MSFPIIKFGTPVPVRFTEKAGLELEALVAGEIEIHKYNERKYDGFESFKSELLGDISELISRCFSKFPDGKGIARRADREAVLADQMALLLAKRLVGAQVTFNAFWLTPESRRAFKDAFGYEYTDLSKKDSVTDGSVKAAAQSAEDKFCRMCGTRRAAGAKFCPECGNKYDA